MSNAKIRKYKKLVERITIIGPRELEEERQTIVNSLIDEGYRITHYSPKPISKYKYDWTKFRIIGEREAIE
jgi:hypothetical protein